ncbi:MAG: type II secretory pathway predicted ATPase ExeA [Pseudohongiellaceae bacterium]|jgi:type II secretory pathway predicted ATPase ExeA
MYQDYFSLKRHPFRITPDTSLFYSGDNQGRGVVLDAMLFAIASGEGILKVVGEVGSGKTMLCRMLEEQLPETTEVVYIANPNLTPDDILYAVAFELKLAVRRDTSKLLVMQQLQNHLLKQHSADRKVLVIIEEAQGMPVETLEEIRLFSNLETHRDKLMQIILFGQPELDKNLSVKHIRQLRERITHSFYLSPLTVGQTAAYIRFRLGAAGCPCPRLFTTAAEWMIAKTSGGLTRRINILSDKALLSAFSENVLNLPEKLGPDVPPVVTARHVYAAIRDSEYSFSILDKLFPPLRIAGVGLVAVTLVVTLVLWPRTAGIASSMPETSSLVLAAAVKTPVQTQPVKAVLKSLQAPAAESLEPESLASFEDPAELVSAMPTPAALALVSPVQEVPWSVSEFGSELNSGNSSDMSSGMNMVINSGAPFLVKARSEATLKWLGDADRQGYTVQFLSGEMNNLEFAESFLEILSAAELIEDSYVCMSTLSGQAYWTIKHGSFSGLSVASKFIDELPEQLHNFNPFVQNISGLECNSNNVVAALMSE